MLLLNGIIAGIVAGILMGIISEIGYRIGIFKSNLILIDGSFIKNFFRGNVKKSKIYFLGISTHVLTSTVFGVIYLLITYLLNLNPVSAKILFVYVFLLWLSMLFIALPVAGQGFFGKSIGSLVWLEQLVLHLFFGIGLWAAIRFYT